MLADVLRPWHEARTWWELCHLSLDPILGALWFAAIVTLLSLSVGLAVTLPLALPAVWLLFLVAEALGRVERSRLASPLGIELPDPHPPLMATSWWRRLLERLQSATRAIDLESTGGGVSVRDSAAGLVTVDSSGGGVRLGFVAPPTDVNADSSGGGVTVEVPLGPTGYRVDARASGGGSRVDVRTDPLGEHRITVRSSGDGVTVRYPQQQ